MPSGKNVPRRPRAAPPRRNRRHERGQVSLRGADARRSAKNILEWNSYLPADCVRTMVRMGWDYST